MKNNKMILLCIICLFACVFMFSCGSDNASGRSLDESNMGGMGTATDYNVSGNTPRNDNMYSDNTTNGYNNNGTYSSSGDGNVNTNNGNYDGGSSYNTGSDMSLDGAVGDLTK